MKDLPLADLEAFAGVAEQRNFRKAAALRGIDSSELRSNVAEMRSDFSDTRSTI